MIELRWVESGWRNLPDGAKERVKVLQYRYKYPYIDDNMDDYPPKYWEWSDWQDVPVVTEE